MNGGSAWRAGVLVFCVVGWVGCDQSAPPEFQRQESARARPGVPRPALPLGPEDGLGIKPPGPAPKPVVFPLACADLYRDDELQEFRIEIDPAAWAALQYEHENGAEMDEAGQPIKVYQPLLAFEHKGRVSTDAVIRLRGNENWWAKQEKMQFQISFNELNKDGRFRGLRKIVLDAGHTNRSHLRDRLAMSVLRDVGVPAPCVNHARLYVNGEFYGLYANVEKIDREFLERNFPDPDGNLWKRGKVLKTNEDEDPDSSRQQAFWQLETAAELEQMGDVENALLAWAAEAVFPDVDGYWAGGLNFYFYEDPERGFVYLPWDIDLAFDTVDATTVDPITWDKRQRPSSQETDAGVNPGADGGFMEGDGGLIPVQPPPASSDFHGRKHVDLVLKDPFWRARFVDAVETVVDKVPVSTLQARIDRWAEQIQDSAREDALAPWSYNSHRNAVSRMRSHVRTRAEVLKDWVKCVRESDGGVSEGCL